MNAAVVAFPNETVGEFAARIVEQAKMTPHPHSYVQAWHHALSEARARLSAPGHHGPAHQDTLDQMQAQIDALAEIDKTMQKRVWLLEKEVDLLLDDRRRALGRELP